MTKAWTNDAWDEFLYWQKTDKKVFKKIIEIVQDIDRNGYEGIGKPERLTGNLSQYYSRRIDAKNRIVYQIVNETIYFIQCGSHYKDK